MSKSPHSSTSSPGSMSGAESTPRVVEPGWTLARVLAPCLLLVVALFLVYEWVEASWLQDADPRMLHALHILRGMSSAGIAVLLATIILFRRVASGQRLPPAPGSWRRRLQHFSLRTKIVVPMVGLAVVPALAIGVVTVLRMHDSLHAAAIQHVEFDTRSRAQAVRQFLQSMQEDLVFLRQMKAVRDLADADPSGVAEVYDAQRRLVEQEFLVFSQGKRAYYQLRFLDGAGREVVRLDVQEGLPWIVPRERLQDKSDRYYVRIGLALGLEEVYVSPMDLNEERGAVEEPHRPVVRYVSVVPSASSARRALVVVNLDGSYVLDLLGPLPPGTEAWLVDARGYFLGYLGPSEEKRQRYDLARRRSLGDEFDPEIAARILGEAGGGVTEESSDALFSAAGVRLAPARGEPGWTLMIRQPREPIMSPIRQVTVFLVVIVALVVALAGLVGILVAHYLALPVAGLQQATRDIAAGDLSKRVDVTTGDEIESLSHDFNRMADRLSAAQDRLSQWNQQLEREVARKTEELHLLQTGLARADKLATIGRMTAAVLHEVGNPLAAIKTRIQVTQQCSDLSHDGCQPCVSMMHDIIHEADRLAHFLRSFMRLTRLPEPPFESVSLVEVVQGVQTLIGPALRSRGMCLRVEAAGNVRVQGNPDALRQLLINLVLNAADASHAGTEVQIRLPHRAGDAAAANRAPEARIEVVDQGAGMAPEVLERIGQPFFTTKPEGTGLGLAICRKIVEDHAGTMQVESSLGRGTVVRVSFPVAGAATGASVREAVR